MHERTNIRLTAADRNELESVVANRNSPQKHVWRAKIVLMTADGHGTAELAFPGGWAFENRLPPTEDLSTDVPPGG